MSRWPTTSDKAMRKRTTAVRLPWRCGPQLPAERYAQVVREAMFDCFKWHTHVEDRAILCSFPLILEAKTWRHLETAAEALAAETLAAENELLGRPDLHRRLGLPASLRACLRGAAGKRTATRGVRVMRFDFHWTSERWRISEANVDVASGFIESSGVTDLIAAELPSCRSTGDPAGALCRAMARRVGKGGHVGLMHLTIYSEDRQVMLYLARRLSEHGVKTCLFSPAQLRWKDGIACVAADWHRGHVDGLVRFFPAEWLPHLSRETKWEQFFVGGKTVVCNPVSAVLAQSKRFPLVWDEIDTPLPRWRELLPETRSPEDLGGDPGDWVLKPALGNEGRDVMLRGVCDEASWQRVLRAARKEPNEWVAQRRFEMIPLSTPEGVLYPCVGVWIVDGRAAGAYGRMGVRPLIDDRSREIAVLIRPGRRSSDGQ